MEYYALLSKIYLVYPEPTLAKVITGTLIQVCSFKNLFRLIALQLHAFNSPNNRLSIILLLKQFIEKLFISLECVSNCSRIFSSLIMIIIVLIISLETA